MRTYIPLFFMFKVKITYVYKQLKYLNTKLCQFEIATHTPYGIKILCGIEIMSMFCKHDLKSIFF